MSGESYQEEVFGLRDENADLQRQLQQAQDAYKVLRQMERESRRQEKQAKEERNAAIERGGQVSAWVRRYFVKASNERKRAEAAEQDAAEQRALADLRLAMLSAAAERRDVEAQEEGAACG